MEQELYEDALTAARDLDGAIVRATRERAREIRAVERRRRRERPGRGRPAQHLCVTGVRPAPP